MDLSVRGHEGTFNFRVAAILVRDGQLLVMQDEGIPHDYLPGGRVQLGDSFTRRESETEIHHFRWVDFADLAHLSFFPIFLKERIFSLPDSPEFISLDSD